MFHNKLISNKRHEDILNVEIFNSINNEIQNIKMDDLKNKCVDCIIITKDTGIHPYDKIVRQHFDIIFPIKWNITKYKFISLVVIINEDEYTIKLNNKIDNYYIVGNIIDKNFIKYYLIKYYKCNIKENVFYTLQLIDQNVKMHILSMNKSIILLENNYEIN